MDFFRKQSMRQQQAPVLSADVLQGELLAAQQEERRMRERLQKLEVEKSLLQNLVDKVYEVEDDAARTTSVREEVAKVFERNSTLTASLTAQTERADALEKEAAQLKKKCSAFEAALENANSELRNADAVARVANTQASGASELQSVVVQQREELDVKDTTISELMQKVAKVASDKQQELRDLEAVVAKTTMLNHGTMEELADKTDRLTTALQDLALTKQSLDEATETIISLRAQTVDPAQLGEARVEGFAEGTAMMATFAFAHLCQQLRIARHAADHYAAYSDAILSSIGPQLVELAVAHRDEAATAMRLRDESAVLNERLTVKDLRITEARGFLAQSEERVAAAEAAITAGIKREEDLESRVAVLSDQVKEAAANEAALATTREQLRLKDDELTTMAAKIQEDQRNFALKQKASAGMIKELQAQLQRREAPSAASASSSSAAVSDGLSQDVVAAENTALIDRIAGLQERVWLLETTKQSYEAAMDKLSNENAEQAAIIRVHFVDAAKRVAQSKGKLAAAFLKPSTADVQAQMQSMVESTLTQNLQLENRCQRQEQEIEGLRTALERACLAGFVDHIDSLDRSMEAVEEEIDDKFQ